MLISCHTLPSIHPASITRPVETVLIRLILGTYVRILSRYPLLHICTVSPSSSSLTTCFISSMKGRWLERHTYFSAHNVYNESEKMSTRKITLLIVALLFQLGMLFRYQVTHDRIYSTHVACYHLHKTVKWKLFKFIHIIHKCFVTVFSSTL